MVPPPLIFVLLGLVRGSEADRGNCPLRPSPVSGSVTLAKLRAEMTKPISGRGSTLEAFIVTTDDQHQSEFVADRDKRLQYISGYKGRSGLAAITRTKAALWVEAEDYWIADAQLDCDWMLYRLGNNQEPQLTDWLRRELRTGVRVGADPKLIPNGKWEDWKRELGVNHIALVETESNLVDDIWTESRPPYNSQPPFFIDTGETREAKLEMLRGNLSRVECGAMVVTSLDEIAWLLNVRGHEGDLIPFVRSYLIVTRAEAFWYIPREHRTDLIYKQLEKHNISRIRTQVYDNIWKDLRSNAASWGRILIPSRCEYSAGASQAIAAAVPPNKRVLRPSPVIFLKARKSAKEAQGMQAAGLRLSAAIVQFMAFLEEEIQHGRNWTESAIAQKVEEYQRNQTNYQGAAAPTQVAFGSHSAFRSYLPDNSSVDAYVDDSSPLVVKAATHYLDGTSSVARTFHFGVPSLTEIHAYTQTLASLIEFSRQIFPATLRTSELDLMARKPLWEKELGYNHSTGHGIGAFSTYHESPININRNSWSQTQVLYKDYFITVGPSQTKPGVFGIQLENVLQVTGKTPKISLRSEGYFQFKEITLLPFETKLIEPSLLTVEQVEYINKYHARVLQEVGAELKRQSQMKGFYWLMQKTNTIAPFCNNSPEPIPVSVIALIFMFSMRYLL